MDSFVKCHYCNKNLTSPLELVCQHSYCAECLTKEVQNDKIVCPVCNTEQSALAGSFTSSKQDKLAAYIIGLNSGAPYSVITDESPPTLHAECSECKKLADLRTCFHCDKPLCADCRTKHFESQKKDVDHSMQSLTTKTSDLVVLAQALNNSRTGRIQEYRKMKDQISAHVKDIIKKVHDEEQELQKKIDDRIQFETDKITVTEREEKYLEKNKAALDEVADKYRDEHNQMVLIKMNKDYLETAPVWKTKLETHAGRLNAKKEEELHFHPNRYEKSDEIIGKVTDSKNVSIHAPSGAKRMAARNDHTESRSCTIM